MATALCELETMIDGGLDKCCEQILRQYPTLSNDPDSVMELLYTEYTIRNELQPNSEDELVQEFQARFPKLRQELERLFQVGKALAPLFDNDQKPPNDGIGSRTLHESSATAELPCNFGDYEILDVLGRGGMGIVYKAVQRSLDRVVAIKTVEALRVGDRRTAMQLTKEAELASQLQHPNIIQIFEVGMYEATPFFSMEYIAGGTLADALRHYPLSPTIAAKLMATVARAVGYAHEKKILHRDLKPSNILLVYSDRPEALTLNERGFDDKSPQHAGHAREKSKSERFEPKVADFGLAVGLDDDSEQTRVLGTPSYMAPEQIDPQFGTIGVQSDVYALGSILYHCLSGRPPFQAPSLKETLDQVRREEARPLSSVIRRIPKDLEIICAKCLKKEPMHRYATALELADDLQRFLTHNPIRAKAPSPLEHASKWTKRHPAATSLIFVCMLTAFTASLFWRSAAGRASAEKVARERAERVLYGSQIALAANELRLHDLLRCRQILDECDPRFRDWEWNYISSSASEAMWESPPATMTVNAADISAEGKLVTAAIGLWGKDLPQTVDVWDVDANQKRWALMGHPNSHVTSVRFHPDGTKLLSAASVFSSKGAGKVLEWNLKTGELYRQIADVNARTAIYAPDGETIVVGTTSGEVQIFNAMTGKLLHKYKEHQATIYSIAFGSQGRFITSSHDGVVCLWSLNHGLLDKMNDMGDARQVVWHAYSNEVWVQNYSGSMHQFDLRNDKFHFRQEYKNPVFAFIAPSPDSMIYGRAGFGDGVELRLLHNDQLLRELHGHRGNVRVISFAANAQRLVTGGADGALRVWDLRSSSVPTSKTLSGGGAVADFVCHPQKNELALAICKSDARSKVFTGNPRLEIRQHDSMQLLRSVDCHADWLSRVAYSPDGKWVATGSLDHKVCIWDSQSLEQICEFDHHNQPIASLSFVDEETVVSMDDVGLLCAWNCRNGTLRSSFQVEAGQAKGKLLGQYLPSASTGVGRFIVIFPGVESSVQLWDLTKQSVIARWSIPFQVHSLAHTLAGNLFAAAGEAGQCLIYDLDKLQADPNSSAISISIGNTSTINSLTFSPSGLRLCSSGEDESVRIFDANMGTELLNLNGPNGRFGLVRFTLDGQSLIRFNGRNYEAWSTTREPLATPDESWAIKMSSLALASENYTAVRFYCDESLKARRNEQQARELLMQSTTLQPQPALEAMQTAYRDLVEHHPQTSSVSILRYLILSDQKTEMQRYLKQWETDSSVANPLFVNSVAWYAALGNAERESLEFWGSHLHAAHRQRKQSYYANSLALLEYRLGNYDASLKLARESLLLDRNMAAPLDWLTELAALVAKSRQLKPVEQEKELTSFQQQAKSTLSQLDQWARAQASRREAGLGDTLGRSMIYQLELPVLLAELRMQLKQPNPLSNLSWSILDQIAGDATGPDTEAVEQ
jgi:serine/threonine protein kinase/WD40 repeat protein